MTEKKQKCLFVTTHHAPLVGGAQTVYDSVASAAYGHFDVLTACSNYATGDEVEGWREFDDSATYRVVRIPNMRLRLLYSPNYFQRLMNFVKDFRIKFQVFKTVKEVSNLRSYTAVCIGSLDALGWLVGWLRHVNVVIYVHGEEVSQEAYSKRAEARRRKALQSADGIIAVSHFTADLIAKKYGVAPEKIEVVTNGVDLSRFEEKPTENVRTQFGLGHGPLVLAVGRLVPRKGFDKLLEAWPRVLASVPEAQLAIGGTGPLGEQLAEQAKQPEMGESVHMLGFVPDDVMPSLYASADLFAMPNRTMPDGDTEGFGLVFLEAAAAGTPSIAGNAGGAVDAVLDGETGRLVDGEDVSAIAYAIMDLLTDEVTRKRMGEAARKHALTQGWPDKAQQILAFLDRLEKAG